MRLSKMRQDCFCLHSRHYRRQRCHVRLLHRLQASEMFEQSTGRRLAYTRNFAQFSGPVADLAALAVESHGEAMGLVADHLHQVENWRMVVEHDWIVFLSENVDDLFALGD